MKSLNDHLVCFWLSYVVFLSSASSKQPTDDEKWSKAKPPLPVTAVWLNYVVFLSSASHVLPSAQENNISQPKTDSLRALSFSLNFIVFDHFSSCYLSRVVL